MHNYSENWQLLKLVLTGHETTSQRPEQYSYEDHIHAKAVSIFLAHATLATPLLDRTTVEAVLAGKQSWPHAPGMRQFEGVALPLSLFEEHGLVAFYAGWCTVHCQTVRNVDDVHPSLIPLVQAVEHLKDICYGRNGYIQPYYTCPADELNKHYSAHFGGALATKLLPELRVEGDHYSLQPGARSFSSLASTNLWNRLRETLEPRQAFEQWILRLRVNCDCAMPPLFDYLEHTERIEFGNQLLAYLAQDSALGLDIAYLYKQSMGEESFARILTPSSSIVEMTIDAEGSNRSVYREIELEKPTLATLNAAYTLPKTDYSSDLQFVSEWQRLRLWREPEIFYTWLLASTIGNSVRIDGQVLASSDFTEALLDLAESRPILKHLLFNSLPRYESTNYKIYLLSQLKTCDIALFYLTQKSFSHPRRTGHSFTQHFDTGYQELVCHEYLRTLNNEPDSGERLLEIVELLGDRCSLHSSEFSKGFEYKFLLCLLNSFSHQHIDQLGQAFAQQFADDKATLGDSPSKHYRYLLGFWLIERLEDIGIDSAGTLGRSLRSALLSYYKKEYEANLSGHRRSLQPNFFFSTLPWHKLAVHEGVGPLLALSSNCGEWRTRLSYTNGSNFAAASAMRHYCQVLMAIGRPQRISKDWKRVANRVVDMVRTLGFGSREEATYLFDGAFFTDQYDLWRKFCSYANLLQDDLYDDFFECCVSSIPLDQLYVLLERCTVVARAQSIQSAIADRPQLEAEDLGLNSLEQAFLSACDSDHTVLASNLLARAKDFLAQQRFSGTKLPVILRARKVWLSYEYKWKLMGIFSTSRNNLSEFDKAVEDIALPHEIRGSSHQEDDRVHWQECDRFRRYIIAAAYCETDPQRCVNIMDTLYRESKSHNHSFMLFKGRLTLHGASADTAGVRYALSQFLDSLDDIEPEHMLTLWVANILDAYRQLHDAPEIDAFWEKLDFDQRNRVEILHPYCKALIARGDALIAQRIITRYRELNLQTSENLGLTELIDELGRALPNELSMSQLIQTLNEDSQRTTIQLAKHYAQIVSKGFETYVSIVGQGQLPHEFLRDAVLDVARELLLRKKNLQIHSESSVEKTNTRITKEDLINDWFTSLFDKRMAEVRVGLRDQKRGGQSASGDSPGEIDGYITDAKNNRVAIFEAFRLFSKDATVISEHLDKIAGYDNESLSPVFIVAYCDIAKFDTLIRGYADFIINRTYTGFSDDSGVLRTIEPLHHTDQLWLGMERRRRNQQEVIFYHLLLNMGC
ncbi:hypothetical protein SAMN05518800_1224 [Variovorax sp. YR752]|uniref:hypothetical protein n=1 Tax=Variovorax sp. YR752 TaxID=1884383 RepID=UPI000BCC7F6D|nr:hypothetical protein [Variovorax sp. YR752]SOD24103.1 hypothetical protein SAMN05518800_1224 [Variovorax sp. YR752]